MSVSYTHLDVYKRQVLLPSVERMEMNASSLFAWCKKRFWRLIKPFYVYIAAHALLILLLPSIFNGNGLKLTPTFLLDSITLSGGINFNWLVLLFIEIALVFPLIYKVSQKKNWSIGWGIASFCFIVATLFMPELRSIYRPIMIIGWSLIVLLSILAVSYTHLDVYKRQVHRVGALLGQRHTTACCTRLWAWPLRAHVRALGS